MHVVAVVALDRRSLEAPELARYPRALMGPIWAAVMDDVFEAGARAVGFDLLFSYSANQFSPNLDAPFLAALNKHRERIVLDVRARRRGELEERIREDRNLVTGQRAVDALQLESLRDVHGLDPRVRIRRADEMHVPQFRNIDLTFLRHLRDNKSLHALVFKIVRVGEICIRQ